METEEVMIELEIIERNDVPAGWLTGFKAYASVADDSQDMLLESLLLRSILRVQEMADKSILGCRFRLMENEVQNGVVRLYQTVKTIDKVMDAEGNDIRWTKANRVISCGAVDNVVIEYTTEANEGAIYELMPVVYQYATALYDGQDSRTLATILMQCR